MQFQQKELLLFDLDGTLIDSVPDLANAVNHTLTSLKKEIFSHNTIRQWVGNGAQTLIKRALSGDLNISEDLDEDLVNNALKIFLEFYKKNLCVETTLYPNVKETLIALKSKGYKLAIITNKPYAFIKPILVSFEIEELFEEYIGADSLELKKPDPYPLLYLCEKLHIGKEKAVMIGDSKNDIIAAINAKIDSIAVTYGYNYDEDISIYNPTIILNDFSKIDEVL